MNFWVKLRPCWEEWAYYHNLNPRKWQRILTDYFRKWASRYWWYASDIKTWSGRKLSDLRLGVFDVLSNQSVREGSMFRGKSVTLDADKGFRNERTHSRPLDVPQWKVASSRGVTPHQSMQRAIDETSVVANPDGLYEHGIVPAATIMKEQTDCCN